MTTDEAKHLHGGEYEAWSIAVHAPDDCVDPERVTRLWRHDLPAAIEEVGRLRVALAQAEREQCESVTRLASLGLLSYTVTPESSVVRDRVAIAQANLERDAAYLQGQADMKARCLSVIIYEDSHRIKYESYTDLTASIEAGIEGLKEMGN